MLPRKTPLALLFILSVFLLTPVASLRAQQGGGNLPLMVVSVKASGKNVVDQITGERWMPIEVVLASNNNINPAAPNKDYFERVGVKVTFAWGDKRNKQFRIDTAFDAAVEIAAMPVRSKRSIFFFLPPEVANMWKIGGTTPTFYYVELSYAGVKIPPTKGSVPTVMQDTLDSLDAFQQVCAEKTAANRGILLPHNLAPAYFLNLTRSNLSSDLASLVFPVGQNSAK